MAVPKRRQSRTRRNKRRATHDRLTPPTIGTCRNCDEPVRPHHVCGVCGHYRGREVIEMPVEHEEVEEAV